MSYTPNGTHFRYYNKKDSKSEVLVLIHGLGLDRTIWDDVSPLLSKTYNVLEYDCRGFGCSREGDTDQVGWSVFMGDFISLLNYLKIESVHIIGHAAGGVLGLELARNHTFVRSLTMLSSPLNAPKEYVERETKSRFTESDYAHIIKQVSPNLCYPFTEMKRERLEGAMNRTSYEEYSKYYNLLVETIINYDLPNLKSLHIPVLLLAGEKDIMYPAELQMLMIGYFQNPRFLILPNASNLMMMDQPKQWTQYIVDFIQSIDKTNDLIKYSYTDHLLDQVHQFIRTGTEQLEPKQSLTVNVVNGFRVLLNDREIIGKWNQRKAKQLFLYITYYQYVTRDQIYEEFWPQMDLQKAQNSLRVSMAHIKSLFEENQVSFQEIFLIDRDSISLQVSCSNDLKEMEKSLQQIGSEQNEINRLERLVEMVTSMSSSMLSSFYEHWVLNKRSQLEDQVQRMGNTLLANVEGKELRYRLLKAMAYVDLLEERYYDEFINLCVEHGNLEEAKLYSLKIEESSFL